jgi:hypothetical protein
MARIHSESSESGFALVVEDELVGTTTGSGVDLNLVAASVALEPRHNCAQSSAMCDYK